MAEVTNRIPFDEARDLLERPGRACVGFVVDGRPHIEAVDLRYRDGRFLVGIGDEVYVGILRAANPEEGIKKLTSGSFDNESRL